ncbi:hypothetical protein I8G32_01369 [Rhodopseudomonas palustris]|uniref:Uncharacterized protein n=1 Tax=Rhodopseudomonas palustris (strain ATCC BAA-98 / CGA009) TaxID=258594 RepID=A0AAE9XYA5_RHOPA|nr:hypothetical protein [Rhodopseudomonas palustris]OPF91410.1 hypothetical protein B1S06_18200 [Rhodopseudomonas palustris]QQM02834.1 hypothetical protein I8G32_01369 [Rhodopseudomonas palustris]RJF60433.1 hypothetical protein D4Q71_23200 [Rhodopseudomonas palustris]WAB79010.1 hypothetical protein OR798_06875 [Rhodopseudomonas palustris]WCL91472.1 hypothetical protein TX73_006870 [Rhodopseudomonas palustris CGA009]
MHPRSPTAADQDATAAELEAAVGQAIEACGGDPVAAVRALIFANSLLEEEIDRVYATVGSWGYLRGRKLPPKSIQ